MMASILPDSMFEKYSLTDNDIIEYSKSFTIVLVLYCIVSKVLIKTPKKLAWSISILNSFVMVLASTTYIIHKFEDLQTVLRSQSSAVDLFHTKNDFTALVCLWFTLANVADILFGLVFYRKYLQLLTAYVHHSVYIWIMYFSVTGNGGLWTSRPFSPIFIFASIEEIPTFLMSLGSINKSLRTDSGKIFIYDIFIGSCCQLVIRL